jgi:hypothetical protein
VHKFVAALLAAVYTVRVVHDGLPAAPSCPEPGYPYSTALVDEPPWQAPQTPKARQAPVAVSGAFRPGTAAL